MDIIESVLKAGGEAGFSASETFMVRQQGVECRYAGGTIDRHECEAHWLAGRFFRDHGDPAGFVLSHPEARAVRPIVADLQSNLPLDRKKNWREHLPAQAPAPLKLGIVEPDYDRFGSEHGGEELERIREALLPFPGVHLLEFAFSKQLRRVYLANSAGFSAKYRKTLFQWSLSLQTRSSSDWIELSESHVSPAQFTPERTVARACNLLRSLSGVEMIPPPQLIFSPEAAIGLLRDFSDVLVLERTDWKYRQTVAASALTIIDNPLLESQTGSVPFDDEGTTGRETRVVSKGVFLEPISDTRSAFARGRNCTGNGFRDGRAVFPQPQFSNLYIRPGTASLGQLMEQAGQGALVTLLRPAGRDADSGDLVYTAYGFHFDAGEVQQPLSFRFRTSSRSFWMHVRSVSKELRFLHGRHNAGSPYLLVESILRNGSPVI
jgi:predicted Zn-dependent protease